MKNTLLLIALIPLIGLSQDTCNCKCWLYVPKHQNKKNSPLHDSSVYSSRMNMFVSYKKTSMSIMLVHDSVDYFIYEIFQYQGWRQKATIYEGQKYSFIFSDSTRYDFVAGELLGNGERSEGTPLTNSSATDRFILPLTDSLRHLLVTKPIIKVVMNNQKSFPRISDRVFNTLGRTDIYFRRIFCCFETIRP